MVRSAMNEGKSTPINIRVTGKNQKIAHRIAAAIRNEVTKIDGVVDARIIQRLDYPEYVIKVDRAKAADLGLTQADVMKNVVAAFNSSIQFNKTQLLDRPGSKNQYFVGVQYLEKDIKSIETLLDIPITSPVQKQADPAAERRDARPAAGADRGHALQPPADDRPDDGRLRARPGARRRRRRQGPGRVRRARRSRDSGRPTTPTARRSKQLAGSKIVLSGEYSGCRTRSAAWASGLMPGLAPDLLPDGRPGQVVPACRCRSC